MGATSIRKSLARGAHQAAKQAKKIVLSMLAVLLVASSISVSSVSGSSVAYAAIGEVTETAGIKFATIDNDDEYDYSLPSGSKGYIYFSEKIFDRTEMLTTYSADGTRTIETFGDIEISYLSDAVTPLNYGSQREYQVDGGSPGNSATFGDADNPFMIITVKNAGYTSDGASIDLTITISTVLARYYDYEAKASVVFITNGADFLGGGLGLTSSYRDYSGYGIGVREEITIDFSFSDSGEPVEDYAYVWKIADLDASSTPHASATSYPEAVTFLSGFENTIIYRGIYTAVDTFEWNGVTYPRVYGTRTNADSPAVDMGFMTTLTGGTFSFLWSSNRGLGTVLSFADTQSSYDSVLIVENTVSGTYSDTTKESTFEVTLEHSDSAQNNGAGTYTIAYRDSDGRMTSGIVTFNANGVITSLADSDGGNSRSTNSITLGANEAFIIYGLPTSTRYTIKDTSNHDTTNYTYTVSGSATSGSYEPDTTTTAYQATGLLVRGEVVTLTFDAARSSGNLTISKTVEASSYADTSGATFEFTVSLYDTLHSRDFAGDFSISYYSSSSSEPAATGTVTLTAGKITSVTAGDTGTITDVVASDGTISLGAGASVTITGLPSGVTYTVSEASYADYNTNSTGSTGVISPTASTATFTNTTKTNLSVTIYKFATTTGGGGGTSTRTNLAGAEYSIVALDSSGNEVTSTRQTELTTGDQGTLTVSNLEALTVYKVTETKAAAGYYLLDDEESFYIKIVNGALQLFDEDGIQFTAGNSITLGGGTVSLDSTNTLQVNIESTENTTTLTLPTTGGSGTLPITVLGVVLVTLAAYALYRQRRGSMYAHAAHAVSNAVATPWQARAASRPQPTRRRAR